MTAQKIATAMGRLEAILKRRPEAGLHDDTPATARWDGGTRVVSSDANGKRVFTDLPTELGGSGDQVTPGWLLRAGLASCLTTRIAMGAAAAGIELAKLEVRASSRSDVRGILGMREASGQAVCAGPGNLQLQVRIAAPAASQERLRALIEESHRCSPVSSALQNALSISLRIEMDHG